MSAAKRVAVVTGSNKGIGFAIVRALCKKFEGDVFLTSRDEGRGQQAVSDLDKEGLKPKYHQLDVTDKGSIENLKTFLQTNYGGLDVLVNNAGIAYTIDSTVPFGEQAEVTMRTNFTATLDACSILFPILRPHARIVNVSSSVSQFALGKCSTELQAKLTEPAITMEGIVKLMQDFVDAAKEGKHEQRGWPNSAYGISKIGMTVMTIIHQQEIASKEDIVINSCCPGYVDTDMSSHKGTKTIDEGADTPVYLALLPHNIKEPKGQFLRDRVVQQFGK